MYVATQAGAAAVVGAAARPERILIAGAPGAERELPRRPGPQFGWHVPAHVREPAAVRDSQAEQIAAGADVIVAQTFRTMRRMLVPYGEARRAREWTEAAITVAREAVDLGQERRAAERGAAEAPVPEEAERTVRVAGSLPSIAEAFTSFAGAARGDALDAESTLRAYREHAERLADGGADLLLVEATASAAEARAATTAAAETGLDVWSCVDGALLSLEPTGARGDPHHRALIRAGASQLLVLADSAASADTATTASRQPAPFGVYLDVSPAPGKVADARLAEPESLQELGARWIGRGVTALGIASGAQPALLRALRTALDDAATSEEARRRETSEGWWEALRDVGVRAPGGRAAWIGGTAGATSMDHRPTGFSWTDVPPSVTPRLPAEQFRLVVCESPDAEPLALARLLERGAWLLARRRSLDLRQIPFLRVVDVWAEQDGDVLVLARRE